MSTEEQTVREQRIEALARSICTWDNRGDETAWDDCYKHEQRYYRGHAEDLLSSPHVAAMVADAERAAERRGINAEHLERQREWSARTFGPGHRTFGVLDHIRKELVEIEADPLDVGEWVDVIILAFDGAWRTGAEPQQIIDAIKAKQARNEARPWPDWRDGDEDHALEHVRENGADL